MPRIDENDPLTKRDRQEPNRRRQDERIPESQPEPMSLLLAPKR
jgi:hypothetical protein